MSLGEEILAALSGFRSEAESLMTDTCEVGTLSAGSVLDETTGEYTPLFTPVYTGKCKFKAGNTAANQVDAASQQLVEQSSTVSFPIDSSSGISKDMIIRFTESLTDPGLPGVVARVEGPSVGSYRTARRFAVEVTS
jgi:hypothetical protein